MTAILSALALLSAALWFDRAALPYNEEGRYFNVAEEVSYDDGAVIAYGALTLVFAALAILAALWAIRAWQR